ncbi:MAG: serine O-acetyltransferase [Thermostichales cyanobacterium BF4_bins_65]
MLTAPPPHPTEPVPPPPQRERVSLWQLLREDVACVFERDPAARTVWEVVLTYPGVHAVWIYRLAHCLWQKRWYLMARILSALGRSLTLIEIHPAATIGRRFFIDHGCGVVIGETAEIGDDVTLYHGVTLGGTSWHRGKRHPTLENGVVVGTGAKILGPVRIGSHARIGANAVVIQDVAPGMTVVGIPGREVLPPERRRILAHGIDLDHHLMPDPVGKAIASLVERIEQLEAQVKALQQSPPPND